MAAKRVKCFDNPNFLNDEQKLNLHLESRDVKVDDSHLVEENNSGFFTSGRDYESAYVNHKYNEKERQELLKYDSLDYLPPWSESYKNWLKLQPQRLDWDRWVMMGLIGFTVGIVGFLLHQFIDLISDTKWEHAEKFLTESSLFTSWIFVVGYSLIFAMASSALVVWIRPSAGGSGIPELIGFLNGTVIRHIFNLQTFLVKFVSCVFAVGSGLPVGPEGPMIHLGGIVGAGLSQFQSGFFNIKPNYFQRFRNSEDRRNFISAGVAAGVSSAFGAPVGGLLFSMEEVSSFWNMKLSWQTFFCCMVSTFTTDLFNSAFRGFRYQGDFGLFKEETNIIFQVNSDLPTHILTFIPTVILGCMGGVLGSMFVFLNLKIARLRRKVLSQTSSDKMKKIIRFVEPCLIMVITATVSVLLPKGFGCTKPVCYVPETVDGKCAVPERMLESCEIVALEDERAPRTEQTVQRYLCHEGKSCNVEGFNFTSSTYSAAATLTFGPGEEAIKHLFSIGTHEQFGCGTLAAFLVLYYFLACWAAGTSISSGLVVPMLLIGGLYGRIVGQLMVKWFGIFVPENPDQIVWSWIDPGAMALIGAASFFGGVSRLTMSLTVIMVEITNDIMFLLPIMTSIMVAKWVGDLFTHPMYHTLLEFKCIPFLDAEPTVYEDRGKLLNLELHQVKETMTSPVETIESREKVSKICNLLLKTTFGGFPVVKQSEQGEIYEGLITRMELCLILQHKDLFIPAETSEVDEKKVKGYHDIHEDRMMNTRLIYGRLQKFLENPEICDQYIDLSPYINKSSVTVQDTFSLHRTYIVFRTLGLRHLPIVNKHNKVVGIITRKDLMGFKLEEKLNIQSNNDDTNA